MSESTDRPITSIDRTALAGLAEALVGAFVDSGQARPVLPAGRRPDYVAALLRMMVDRETLNSYVPELRRARTAAGVDLRLLELPCRDLREAAIARDGFGALADDELAEIAIDPAALGVLSDYLWGDIEPEPERGDWWWGAVTAGELEFPEIAERVARELEGEGTPPGAGESVLPFDPGRAGRRPGGALPWIGRLAALAASLLVGVFLGRFGFEGGGGGDGPGRVSASASAAYGAGRGAEKTPVVRFESGLSGFATVVATAPGKRPEVFPALGRDDVEVRAGAPTEFGPLPAGTREALVIVTETPAADPVRRVLRAQAGELADAESVRRILEPQLRAKGYRKAAFAATTFSTE